MSIDFEEVTEDFVYLNSVLTQHRFVSNECQNSHVICAPYFLCANGPQSVEDGPGRHKS